MNVNNFASAGRQLNIAHNIYLRSAVAYNMLHFNPLFVLGNWLHVYHLLLSKRLVALFSIMYERKVIFVHVIFRKNKNG